MATVRADGTNASDLLEEEKHKVDLATRVETLGRTGGQEVGTEWENACRCTTVKEKYKKAGGDGKAGPHSVYRTVMSKNAGAVVLCNSSNNNSNTEHATSSSSAALSACSYLRKSSRLSSPSCLHNGSSVEVSLEGKSLWEEFCRRGTEMIVNRSGRRMFPGFSVAISCLKPKMKYSMKLEVVLADNHRFKFLNSKWLAVGSAEPQAASELYLHPDSANSGAFWMRHGVSFRKLKITNNKEKPGSNVSDPASMGEFMHMYCYLLQALLYSMHKYFLRLVVEEEGKTAAEGRAVSKVIARLNFPETTFIAVTAYQNEEVTQLKITNNPFAKAFRESATDVDWETAQMFCSGHGRSPYQQAEHHLGAPLLASGGWPLPSPLMSPATLVSGALPLSFTVPGLASPSSTGSSNASIYSPYTPQYSCPHHFQWPLAPPPPPLTPPLLHYGHNNHYSQQPCRDGGVANGYYQSSSTQQDSTTNKAVNLPDFETVFTPSK